MSEWSINPDPGPRPLAEQDAEQGMLVGRETDINELMYLLSGHRRMVGLSAESGMGKTSLLRAGLVPRLREVGFTVAYFDRWQLLSFKDGASNFIQALLHSETNREHRDEWPKLFATDQPLQSMENLERRFGDRVIIVLDQLEELFRLDSGLGSDFIHAVGEVLTAEPRFGLRIVLSLRREFRAELGPLERLLLHSMWVHKDLDPVNLEFLPQMVTIPLRGAGALRLGNDCALHLADAWKLAAYDKLEAASNLQSLRVPKVGLIHMQALLWVLWRELQMLGLSAGSDLDWDALTRQPIHFLKVLRNLLERPADGETGARCRDLFQEAIASYVEARLGDHRAVCSHGSADAEDQLLRKKIADETWGFAALVAPQLSSAGYKVVQNADSLAFQAPLGFEVLSVEGQGRRNLEQDLVRDIRAICLSQAQQEAGGVETEAQDTSILKEGDPVGDYERVLARLLKDHTQYRTLLGPRARQVGDRAGVSAGRMQGASPARITVEVAITYCRALQWLQKSHIVRFTPGQTMKDNEKLRDLWVSAIHDSFGQALRAWGQQALVTPEVANSQFVALRGKELLRQSDQRDASERRLVSDFTFEKAVWHGCIITADLDRVTFRNCDLRGLLLLDCDIREVLFEDCITWGMLIKRCRFFGKGMTFKVSDRENPLTQVNGLSLSSGCSFGLRASRCFPEQGGFHASGEVREASRDIEPGRKVPLKFIGMGGYGLFLDDIEGAHWILKDCDLRHVSIGTARSSHGSGRIVGGKLRLVSISGAFPNGGRPSFKGCEYSSVFVNEIEEVG